MNIQVLFEKPELIKKASLFIEPLAPLSLVTSMPGAYYRSQREPSEFMIFGMLENLLGWHFTDAERNPIIRDLIKHHKKKNKLDLNFDKTPVGFRPLLQYHLQVEKLLLKPHIESYEDYWTQHLKDSDNRHLKGVRNYDHRLDIAIKRAKLIKEEKLRNEAFNKIIKDNTGLLPNYYQSPTKREFIIVKGEYGLLIKTTKNLLELLTNALNKLESPLYLGTNEGWVNLNIN